MRSAGWWGGEPTKIVPAARAGHAVALCSLSSQSQSHGGAPQGGEEGAEAAAQLLVFGGGDGTQGYGDLHGLSLAGMSSHVLSATTAGDDPSHRGGSGELKAQWRQVCAQAAAAGSESGAGMGGRGGQPQALEGASLTVVPGGLLIFGGRGHALRQGTALSARLAHYTSTSLEPGITPTPVFVAPTGGAWAATAAAEAEYPLTQLERLPAAYLGGECLRLHKALQLAHLREAQLCRACLPAPRCPATRQ